MQLHAEQGPLIYARNGMRQEQKLQNRILEASTVAVIVMAARKMKKTCSKLRQNGMKEICTCIHANCVDLTNYVTRFHLLPPTLDVNSFVEHA